MISVVKSALASLAVAAVTALPAAAATLGLDTKPAPVIDIPFAEASYLEFGGAGDFFFTAPATGLLTGVASPAAADFEVLLSLDPADPSGPATLGTLFSYDPGDGSAILDGDVVATGFEEDIVELLLGNLSGSAAAAFGERALVELFFLDPLGADPLAGLGDGETYAVAATISAVAPVPLPGGLPLLAGGVLLLAGCRARRARG